MCWFNLYQVTFGALSIYTIYLAQLHLGSARYDRRLAAAGWRAFFKSVLALSCFILDDFHAFGFDYWHALWHVAAWFATSVEMDFLLEHTETLQRDNKRDNDV
jgi:hypothetical protein